MKQKLLGLIFVLTCFIGMSYAQNRQVSGRVTSAGDGRAIAGVSVSVVGTTTATQTDGDGNYSITVPNGSVLNFSFIGYASQRVTVGNQSVINVQLASDVETLDEVVVVGYGTTTQETFTGSAKKVSAENIERKSASNITQALSGEVAGLSVVNGTGQPGTAATIRIRGFGSVNGNRSPLYVVDGVPFGGELTSINNADIESTTVLKDAAATAIYGSRGANGVILINTKNGKGKESFVEADVNYGTNMALLPRYDVIRSPEEYVALSWESLYNQGVITGESNPTEFANNTLFGGGNGFLPISNIWNASGSDLIDPQTRQFKSGITRKWSPENWEDYAFQSAARQDYNVKFGGSSEKSNYYTSLGYLNDKGYSIQSDFERFSGRMNLDHKVKPWLNTGFNLGFSRSNRNSAGQSEDSGSIFWFIDNIPSLYPLFERDANGNKIEDSIYGGYRYDYGEKNERRFGAMTNSISDAVNSTRLRHRNEVNGRTYLNFNILKGLTLENSLGLTYFHQKYLYQNSKFYGSSASTNGYTYQERTERFSYTLLNLLRYRTSFGLSSIEALLAHESQKWENNILSGSKSQLVRDDLVEFDNAVVTNPFGSYTNRYTMESYFGQVNYDYNGVYFLSGSLRRDGSSRFVNNKWGTFGSIGAAWILSKESFMQDQNVFNFLKLKASYGVIGDQNVGQYYPGLITYPISPLDGRPAIGAANVGNPDLTWEKANMFQAGVEFNLGNYVSGSIDYYIKNTSDLIFDRRVGPSLGYALMKVNDGKLRNSGLEFDLTGHLLNHSDYYLDLNINGEMFTNKITTMPLEPSTGLPKIIDVQGAYGWAKGRSIYDFYIRDFVGVDPTDGRSMWKVYYTDNNGDGEFTAGEQISSLAEFDNTDNRAILEGTTKTYSQATLHHIGKSAIPKVRGAMNLQAGYKNFDLAVQMIYSFGGYAYDGAYATLMNSGQIGGNNWHRDIFNRWQKEGDITDVPRLSNAQDPNVSSQSTRFLTKANYLSLNNVRLSYNFNATLTRQMGIEGLGIWVSADNLWYHSKRAGFYPSTSESGSSNMYRYSPLSTFSAGLRAKF